MNRNCEMYSVQAGMQSDGGHQQQHSPGQHGPGPYQHLNLRQYIPDNIKTGITDEQLVLKPTKDLNKMLKSTGLPKEDVNKIKQKRRTLKNRGYAASCRNKRELEEESLKVELENLQKDISDLKRSSSEKKIKIEQLRASYKFRQEWAKNHTQIKLPEHLIRNFPPEQADSTN
eukprot:TRINITY_DN35799_c0_g1_i1.p1 TRINITY_DN35799_c0_g1~~TRINITY_DN35799_c0_g1_i1.p1  ORF type:complete len:173 (-),score=45.17 TRINITY_DN35799_c0_g1_i1:48-566(-)